MESFEMSESYMVDFVITRLKKMGYPIPKGETRKSVNFMLERADVGLKYMMDKQFPNDGQWSWADCCDYHDYMYVNSLVSVGYLNNEIEELLAVEYKKEKEKSKRELQETMERIEKEKLREEEERKAIERAAELKRAFLEDSVKKSNDEFLMISNSIIISTDRTIGEKKDHIVRRRLETAEAGKKFVTDINDGKLLFGCIDSNKDTVDMITNIFSTTNADKKKYEIYNPGYVSSHYTYHLVRENGVKSGTLPVRSDPPFIRNHENKVINEISINMIGPMSEKLICLLIEAFIFNNYIGSRERKTNQIVGITLGKCLVMRPNRLYACGWRVRLIVDTTESRTLDSVKRDLDTNVIPAMSLKLGYKTNVLKESISNYYIPTGNKW